MSETTILYFLFLSKLFRFLCLLMMAAILGEIGYYGSLLDLELKEIPGRLKKLFPKTFIICVVLALVFTVLELPGIYAEAGKKRAIIEWTKQGKIEKIAQEILGK